MKKILVVFFTFIFINNLYANELDRNKIMYIIAKVGDNTIKNLISDEAKTLGYKISAEIVYAIVSQANIKSSKLLLNKIEEKAIIISGASNPLSKANKLNWIFLITDIMNEAIKDVYYPHNEAKQLLQDTIYGNIKAGIQYGTATNMYEKAGASIAWMETNTKAIVNSAAGMYKLYKEKTKLDNIIVDVEKYNQITKLKYDYEKKVCQESNKKIKMKLLNEFESKCIKIGSKNKFYPQYCRRLSINIELFDQIKYFNLFYNIKNNPAFFNDKQWVKKYIENYFPKNKQEYVKQMYNLETFEPDIGTQVNSSSYNYLKKLNAYGIRIKKGIFEQYKEAPIGLAANMISIAKYGNMNKAIEILNNAGYTNDTSLTRKKYAKLLVDNLPISSVKLSKNQKATFIQWSLKRRPYYDSRLAAFEIIPSNEISNKTLYLLRSTSKIKYYMLIRMLADSLDIVTCGHKGCSYEEILKGGN